MAAGDADCALRTDGSPGRNIAFSNVQPKNLLCVLSFLAVCAGMLVFLNRFTQSESAFLYPAWETGGVVSPDGKETAFDPAGQPPPLAEGETYRYTLTLPEDRVNGAFLIFETAELEVSVYLDRAELWRSAGDGETLVMDLRPLSETALVPPIPRISADPTDQAGAIAYANYYGGCSCWGFPAEGGTGCCFCPRWQRRC